MWGVSYRLTGATVELAAQGWQLHSAATYSLTRYMHELAGELSRDPDRYGFDPGLAYVVLAQTWDRATSSLPSLAFGRPIGAMPAVQLVPDVYYLDSDGFRRLREEAAVAPAWHDRSPTLVWRGSVTGSGPYSAADQIPRVRLALAAKSLPDTDMALIGVHSTMASVVPPEAIEAFMAEHGLRGEPWELRSFGRYKLVLDIDGHANAWGLLEKFILGCCVLKVASPYEQWFYHRMLPGVHYVPVRADLADLADVLAWCRDNEDRCERIARNGALLARSLASDRQVETSCEALLKVAHVSGRFGIELPSIRSARPVGGISGELLGQAAAAEGAGDFDRAIALYDDASARAGDLNRRVEALMRKAALHREMGQIGLAVEALARAADLAPDDAVLKLQVAQFASSIGRDFAALDNLIEAVAMAGHFAELRINLADHAVRVGWLDVAYWAVRDLPADLSDWWARARHTALSRHEGAREQAKSLLRARRAQSGLTYGLRWDLALVLASLGRLRMAERLCSGVIAETPVLPPHDLMSRIVARRRGSAAAIDYLEALPDHFRKERDFVIRLARFMLDQMRFEPLLELLERHPEFADTFDSRFCTTIALISLGRKAELLAHCQRWMEGEPEDVPPAGIVAAAHPTFAIPREEQRTSTGTIPLVQFWDAAEVPADVLGVMDGWVSHNPGVARTIVSDEQARAFLLDSLGRDAAETYELCHHVAMKADVFRMAWLHVHGGIYVDADEACLRPMGALLAAAADCEVSAVRSGDMLGYLHNYFLGARAGSRVMGWALEEATRAIHDARAQGQQPSIWHATGPGLITRAAGRYLVTPGAKNMDRPAIFLPIQQYKYYARTESDLSYKRKRSANWQLA